MAQKGMTSEMKTITTCAILEWTKKIPLYSLPAAWNDAGDIKLQHNRTTIKISLTDKLLEEIWQEIL
jgi:hypothetical protein